MQAKKMEVIIVTPEGTVYEGNARSVQAPGFLGKFEILYNHAPFISTLQKGKIKIHSLERKKIQEDGTSTMEQKEEKLLFETSEGILEVSNNRVVIAVEHAKPV